MKKLPDLFECFESDLKKKIESKDDPFLGIFVEFLSENTKKHVLKCIEQTLDPLDSLINNLFYYPALTATLLVEGLLNGVGQNGYFEVYPILEKMLGVAIHPASKKRDLWQAFRHACMRLGLEVSSRNGGPNFMVEEYLRQAGLPLAYVNEFASKAVRYADENGVPEEDDHESLGVWQEGLLERLNPPFPIVAKRAIQRDHNSYYSSVFVRLYRNSPSELTGGLSKLERTILAALKDDSESRKVRELSIPDIVVRDLEYGIHLPAATKSGTKWHVNIDGNEINYTSHSEDRFIPFESKLMSRVVITRGLSRWVKILWDDIKNNRLLIFALPTGRFVRCANLTERIVELTPGDYTLLLRFKPDDAEHLEFFSGSPEIYSRTVTVRPGEDVVLQRGPAVLALKGIDIPALTWTTKPLRGVRGNEVFPVKGLSVGISIPDEYLSKNKEYSLKVISSTLGEPIEIDVLLNEGSSLEVGLEQNLKSWRHGVGRLAISLHQRGSLKALAKKSAIVWNGLVEVNRRIIFRCSELPFNLDRENSINVRVDGKQNCLTYKDPNQRFFKFSFSDGRVIRYFTWTVPGIFLSLINYNSDGTDERSLPLGSIIPVSKVSRKTVQIFASNIARLKLGDFQIDVDFERIGSKNISLASLLEYTSAGENALLFIDRDSSREISLFELVTPSTVEEYKSETDNGLREICIKSLEKIEGLQIEAKNMLNGEKRTVEILANVGASLDSFELLRDVKVFAQFPQEDEVTCLYPVKNWPEGMWVIKYQLKSKSRWGAAMNKMGEELADSVLSSPVQYAVTSQEVFDVFCKSATVEQKVYALLMIHDAMMTRFSENCWPHVSWLKSCWHTLCSRYVRFNEDPHLWGKLLRRSFEWPEEAIAEGHVTTSILSGYLLHMFCFERTFVPVVGQVSCSFLSCMAAFPQLGDSKRIFEDNIIDTSVLFGFENAALVCAGSSNHPVNFSMARFSKALKAYDVDSSGGAISDQQWLPVEGTYLGASHYKWALGRFRERYMQSLTVDSERRGFVLGMVRHMSRCTLDNFMADKLIHNHSWVESIDLGLFSELNGLCEILSEEESITQEHLRNMIRFVSLLAQVCRAQARNPGCLSTFLNHIKVRCEISGNHVSNNLGYLIFLSEDVFAFYLMLWEVVFTAELDTKEEFLRIKESKRIYVRN